MTWTFHDGRWYLIGAPEFVIAWEGDDGRFHWSVGTRQSSVTTTIGSGFASDAAGGSRPAAASFQTGHLSGGGLEAAKARAIEVMEERYRERVAALRVITDALS